MMNNLILNGSSLLIIIILTLIILSPIHIIIESNIDGKDARAVLKIRYFYSLLRFKINLYPIKKKAGKKKDKTKKDKKKKNKSKERNKNKRIKVSRKLIHESQQLVKNIKKEEIYLYFKYGSSNVQVTSFAYVLVNIIYGHIIAYFDSKKMYFNMIPSYIEPVVKVKFKLHIKITIKDIIGMFKLLYIFIKDNKGGGKFGSSKFSKKSYGKNS